MDFKEFKEQISQDILGELPEKYKKADINFELVEKLQGQSYEGMVIRPQGSQIGVSINLEEQHNLMNEGSTYDEVLDNIVDIAIVGIEKTPQVDVVNFTDYEQVKGKLMVELVGTERNQKRLSHIPHTEVEDMSAVYRANAGEAGGGMATVLITNEMLNHYGVSVEQLHQDAIENAAQTMPANFRSMNQVLNEMMGNAGMELDMGADPLYVLSNDRNMKGASAILYPDVMKNCAEQLEGNFYVLPSSVHEVLLVPESFGMSRKELEGMVSSVNSDEVTPEEQLTDHVYHYDAKDKVFELAEKYEKRMASKEKETTKSVLKSLEGKKNECKEKTDGKIHEGKKRVSPER